MTEKPAFEDVERDDVDPAFERSVRRRNLEWEQETATLLYANCGHNASGRGVAPFGCRCTCHRLTQMRGARA